MSGKSLYLKKNVGTVDQVIRLTLGVVLVAIPVIFQFPPWTIAILAAIGGAMIVEGITAY